MADFRTWKLDFSSRALTARKSNIADPPGFDSRVFAEIEAPPAKRKHAGGLDAAARARKENALRQKAMEPLKQAGFMCFVLWMSGNSLQIFSIMTMVSCLYSPIHAIANVTKAFPPQQDLDVLLPRLIYCGVYLGQLAFAVHKLNSMGLLPTYASDWVSQMKPPSIIEMSIGPRL
jgi:ER membrane protein complex subunit 4